MLEPVGKKVEQNYVRFAKIRRCDKGTGLCFCYNAEIKTTKYGHPFVKMMLRDIDGATIPGYVFDLQSPLLAGREALEAAGHVVSISYEENFLEKTGQTVIVSACAVVTNVPSKELSLFTGSVPGCEEMLSELTKGLQDHIGIKITLPVTVTSYASAVYAGGRVGGLISHYYQMYKALDGVRGLNDEERRRLISTFVLYIFAHGNYLRAAEQGADDISLLLSLTEKLASLESKLELGSGCKEIVHCLFGVKPTDIYVRTVFSVADSVLRVSQEFEKYRTIPISQEGDAGYGRIRRYQADDAN